MLTFGTTQEEARKILGKDFSSIETALDLFPALSHPKKYKAKMALIPYSTTFLRQRKGSLIIFPGFNRFDGDIFSLQLLNSVFFEKTKPHLSYHNRHFNALTFPEHQLWSGTENFFSGTADLRWYAISKQPKAPYKHISIFSQDAIMEPGRMRENAFVYTWAAWLHFLQTGEFLWSGFSIWTSDILPDGRRMAIGGWENASKPVWALTPTNPDRNLFPKTVPSYQPNIF